MFEIEQKLRELNALVSNLFRVGTVTSTNDEACRARVVFEDRNNMESAELQVLVKNTLNNQDYWMPDVGEDVLCFFLPIGLEQGFIVGSFYTSANTAPTDTKDKRRVVFDDGTSVEYDRATHKLTAEVLGDVDLNVTGNLTAGIGGSATIDVGGNITETVGGNMKATVSGNSDLTAPTINLNGVVNVNGALNLAGPLSAVPGGSGGGATLQGNFTIDGSVSLSGGDVTADGISLKQHTHTHGDPAGTTSPPQ